MFHKENGGVSSARNYGLNMAKGVYVLFLDSDDYLMRDALMQCKKIMQEDSLDVLQFSIQGVGEDGKCTSRTTIMHETTNVLSPEKYMKCGQVMVCAGGSCIKREIIEKNNIRFKQNIKLAEDQLFVISSLLLSKRMKFENKVLYNYLDNPDSATHSNKSKDVINSIKEIEKFILEYPLSKDKLNMQILTFICILLRNKDVTINEISCLIGNKSFGYSRELRTSEKFFCMFSKINFRFACFITGVLLGIYYHGK